jgi:hypothetical protein
LSERKVVVTDHTAKPHTYEPPALEVLGSVHALTLDGGPIDKHLGTTDGFTFMGQGITHLSN